MFVPVYSCLTLFCLSSQPKISFNSLLKNIVINFNLLRQQIFLYIYVDNVVNFFL